MRLAPVFAAVAALILLNGPAIRAAATQAPASASAPASSSATPAPADAATGVSAVSAVPAAPEMSPVTVELEALVRRVKVKLQAGQHTAAELKDELGAFDALLAKYHDRKTDDVAMVLYMESTLYAQVFEDAPKAKELAQRIKAEFPGTQVAAQADQLIAGLDREANAAAVQAALVGKPAPELHFMWSNREGLKSLGDLKGKVVVLDFWATWCGPCVASFPFVRELTTHYKDAEVVVVGVTSIQGSVSGLQPARIDTRGDPKKEISLLGDFIAQKQMTWSVAVSDEEVFNPAYGIQGIPYMTIIAPDGTIRHTGLHPAMEPAKKIEMIDAILREFGKPVPPA